MSFHKRINIMVIAEYENLLLKPALIEPVDEEMSRIGCNGLHPEGIGSI